MNKKGFVLMETIVVITVLSLVLTLLYASFNVIISKSQKNISYDNTEYIYKTQMIRDVVEDTVETSALGRVNTIEAANDFQSALFDWLDVQKVYILLWDPTELTSAEKKTLEATTQQYLKYLDPYENGEYRIVVMYKDANDSNNYQYSSLRWMEEA